MNPLKKMCLGKNQALVFKDAYLCNTYNFKTSFQLYKALSVFLKGKDYSAGEMEIYVGNITIYLGVVEYSTSL